MHSTFAVGQMFLDLETFSSCQSLTVERSRPLLLGVLTRTLMRGSFTAN